MFDLDKWQEIFATIRKNKMRTFLTGFSVAWGIFMLMVLLGSGNGLQNGVTNNFKDNAVNAMWIWTGKTKLPYKGLSSGRTIQFHNDDYDLVKNIPGVESLSGRYSMGNTIYAYGKESGTYTTITCHPELNDVERMKISEGRFINQQDIVKNRKVVVLGKDIQTALFDRVDPVGKYVRINQIPFLVVGICEKSESTRNRDAYMPVSTAQKVFNGSNELSSLALTISAKNMKASQRVENQIRGWLARKHRFAQKDEGAVGIYNKLENYMQTQKIFTAIRIFIWIIGMGTLMAGIVGVSNIMLIVVKERTKEIGVRKALGASPSSVVGLILMEAVTITAFAGYIGLTAGTLLMEGVNWLMVHQGSSSPGRGTVFMNPTVDIRVALSATILLIVAGAVAGYIPARRAARIKPIVALRDE